MIKIGFFEWEYHGYVASSVLNILFYTGAKITVFCSKKVEGQLKISCDNCVIENIIWIVIKDGESFGRFLNSHKIIINQQDLLWFYTASSHFKLLYQFHFKPPTYLYVANSNTTFGQEHRISITKYIKYFIVYQRYSIRYLHPITASVLPDWWCFFSQKKWFSSISYFVFSFEKLSDYALKNKFCLPEQTMVTPMGYCHFISAQSLKKITLTIPGEVSETRRNYKMILQLIARLAPSLDIPLDLVLLGRPYRNKKHIIKLFHATRYPNITITTFERSIPEKEYQNYLEKTTCLLSPLMINTTFTIAYHVFQEQYGESKSSGIIRDALAYTTPVFLPSEFKVDKEFSPIALFYSSEDQLLEKIQDMIQCIKRGRKWLHQERKSVFNYYRLEAVARRTKKTLQNHFLSNQINKE